MPTTTLTVTNKDAFDVRLEKLNKKLAKKNLPLVDVLNVDMKLGETVIMDGDQKLLDELYAGYTRKATRNVNFEITVDLPVAMLEVAGVIWVGKQEVVTGGRKLVCFDKSIDLEPYRTQEMSCDHCGWKRDRKTTYFFLKDGAVMQIGSTCVDEYFGVELLYLLEEFTSFCTTCSEDRSTSIRTDVCPSAWYHIYMTAAAYYISTEGFKGRKRYEMESTDAKAGIMANWLTDPFDPTCRVDREIQAKYQEAFTQFKEMLDTHNLGNVLADAQEYWATWDKPDTFLQNCKTAILGASIKMRGFFASAMKEYLSTLVKAAPAPAPAYTPILEEFVGKEGDLLEVTGKVLKCQYYDNGYQGSYHLVVLDSTNHRFGWWATVNPKVMVGNMIKLTGRVKKHDDYQGKLSTVLTRCKLELLEVK